ncbi:MAG: porin [Rhodocyclaceae bacterium]|nr:porin [Rhodocyclaceae bacterium]
MSRNGARPCVAKLWRPQRKPATMNRLHTFVCLALGTLSLPAAAGSFYLPASDSTAAMGRAFAGQAALGIDASSVMTNPAALTRLPGDGQWLIGVNALRTHVHLRDQGSNISPLADPSTQLDILGNESGNASAPAGLPNLAWAQRIGGERNLWLGVGVQAPYGLGIEYDNAFKGRYDTREARLRVIDLSAVAGLQLTDTLSVGGGINVQRTDARLEQALPIPRFPNLVPGATDDLALIITGDSYAVGGNLGLHFKPNDDWQFGLTYRSAITHKVEGDARVDAPIPGNSSPMSVKLHLPDSVAASAAWKATEDLTLLAELKWVNWSRLKNLTFQFDPSFALGPRGLKPDDYRDGYSLALGADYRLNPQWTVRAGYQYEQTPTINGNRSTDVPDANRHWFAVGASWAFQPGWGLDMSYARLQFENVVINRNDASSGVVNVNTHVTGRPSADFLGMAVRRAF